MSNPQHIARAHAFARILGWLYTDGTVSYREDSDTFEASLWLGHRIDVDRAVKDITLVLGRCGEVQNSTETRNCYRVRINVSEERADSYAQISLPSAFARAVCKDKKIQFPYGKRSHVDYVLPDLVTDAACPKSFVREFLGGLFGGDGDTPQPSAGENAWCSIKFSITKVAQEPRSC